MNWIRENIASVLMGLIAAALVAVSVVMSGCNVADFVKVDVPAEVQTAIGAPARVPLSASEGIMARFQQHLRETSEKLRSELTDLGARAADETTGLEQKHAREIAVHNLKWVTLMRDKSAVIKSDGERYEIARRDLVASVGRGQEQVDFIAGMLNMGLQAVSGPLSGVPFGAVALAGLTGGIGLMVRKPGTQKEIDAAYEEGRREERAAIREGALVAAKV